MAKTKVTGAKVAAAVEAAAAAWCAIHGTTHAVCPHCEQGALDAQGGEGAKTYAAPPLPVEVAPLVELGAALIDELENELYGDGDDGESDDVEIDEFDET